MSHKHKLYVLIDPKLSEKQRAVQAGHAIAQILIDNPDLPWRNHTLVYLGCDRAEMKEIWEQNPFPKAWRAEFREPFYQNRQTAIAYHGEDVSFPHLNLI